MLPAQVLAATEKPDAAEEKTVTAGTFDIGLGESGYPADSEPEEADPEEDLIFGDAADPLLLDVSHATISGKVTDSSGTGTAGVSVLLYDVEDGDMPELCTTSTSCRWSSSAAVMEHT